MLRRHARRHCFSNCRQGAGKGKNIIKKHSLWGGGGVALFCLATLRRGEGVVGVKRPAGRVGAKRARARARCTPLCSPPPPRKGALASLRHRGCVVVSARAALKSSRRCGAAVSISAACVVNRSSRQYNPLGPSPFFLVLRLLQLHGCCRLVVVLCEGGEERDNSTANKNYANSAGKQIFSFSAPRAVHTAHHQKESSSNCSPFALCS